MFGQKRAHSPDGYEDNNYRQTQFGHGPPHDGHHQFHPHQQYGGYNKRYRSNHYQQPLTIEDKIARLGETGSRNVDIGILAKDIDADLSNKGGQEEELIKQLTAKICKSIVSFPTRVGTYSTLIGLISVKRYNVACQIIQTLHASYPVYLEAQRWQEALSIIHLLSSLVNCKVIKPSALLSQFQFLLESTIDENSPQARTDYFVYTVLSSLPFVAFELSQQEDLKESFDKMLTTIEIYLDKRSKEHLRVTRVWMSNDSTIQMDYLDSLWVQTKNFRANNWVETFLSRPYNEKEYSDTMASNLIPTNSPAFQIPGHSDKYLYPHPRIVFRIYEDDVVDNQKPIPGSDKIERFCIENHIRNLIDENMTDTRTCARHLTHMFHGDQLPLKHLIIETILGELFMLPQAKHDAIVYYILLFEFTKIFNPSEDSKEIKNNYEIVLNEAVKILFENLETMNVACITRFVEWFSFHLNNTGFIFPWQTLADSITREECSPKPSFVRDLLERCVRFTFHGKISGLIKDSKLENLMPPEVCVKCAPIFVDKPEAGVLAKTVRELIAYKASGAEICTKLNIRVDGVALPDDFVLRDEKISDQLLKIDIFTSVLLDMAQKSLTHLSSAIGKFRNVIKALTKVPQGQIQLLHTLHSCLSSHPQLQIILVDKLLKAELLEAKEICNWIFSEDMKPFHVKSYLWDILRNTIARCHQNIENVSAQKSKLIKNDEEERSKGTKDNDGSGTPNGGDDDNASLVKAGDVEMKDAETTEETTKPTLKEDLEKLDIQAVQARDIFNELILLVFMMFANAVSDHISDCENKRQGFMDWTYRWLTGRMQEIYYNGLYRTGDLNAKITASVVAIPSLGGLLVNLNQ